MLDDHTQGQMHYSQQKMSFSTTRARADELNLSVLGIQNLQH